MKLERLRLSLHKVSPQGPGRLVDADYRMPPTVRRDFFQKLLRLMKDYEEYMEERY